MRLKKVQVAAELVTRHLTADCVIERCVIQEGLPEGAALRCAYTEPNWFLEGSELRSATSLVLVFEHESFPEIDPGELPPELHVVVAMRNEQAAR